MIVVKDQPLHIVAQMMIEQGMFDTKGGRYCGGLVAYQQALLHKETMTSFYMIPQLGFVGHFDGQFQTYVAHRYRGCGKALEMAKEYVKILGHEHIKLEDVQFPTCKIFKKAIKEVAGVEYGDS